MDYVNLGQTGLKVSRICLGMMTYGTEQWRPWILEEADARPIVQRAVELGVNFFDTADMYSAGASEELTGKFLREFTRREEVVIATKVFFPVDMAFQAGSSNSAPPPPNTAGLSRKHIFEAVERPSSVWGSITSIFIKSIAGITTHPSRRPWKPCTISSNRAKCVISERPACGPGSLPSSSHRPIERVGTVCIDAEPLQLDLSGGGA